MTQRNIELLAPARNAEIARAAIDCGADAVYIGPDRFGARASAGNSVADIGALCEYAHRFGSRVYATVNTLIYENELQHAEWLATDLWRVGVDALIVQDMAMLRLDLPPIALHASTQCDIRTPEKARFLAGLGFSQLVLPRELSLDEIAAIAAAVPGTPLEAFVHGALCVSYSGDCQASYAIGGRSANRGECAQICRLPFVLSDGSGRALSDTPRHYLSLRDLQRADALLPMMEAGITSFKIEGRLKDETYVKNVTAYYSRAIDNLIASVPDRYRRQSYGRSDVPFEPALEKSFNRGFTSYFLNGRQPQVKMASMLTPKSQGEHVGSVKRVNPDGSITATLRTALSNGDGLGYFDEASRFTGFRVNRVDGTRLYPASKVAPRPGTQLFRNSDTAFDREVARKAMRSIGIEMRIWPLHDGRIALEISDERGVGVATASLPVTIEEARSAQDEAQQRVLSKLGGSIYRAESVDTSATGGLFIPVSLLAALRRQGIELLDRAASISYRRDVRRSEDHDVECPYGDDLTRHDNVANSLAERVYREHGVTGDIPPAAEVAPKLEDEPRVMTTRYCVRRELGACLRTAQGRALRGPLVLSCTTPAEHPIRLRLDFDCANCRMHVVKL